MTLSSLCFHIALSKIGLKEIPGEQHEPAVVDFFAATGNKWIQNDETAWCGAFASWVLKMALAELHPSKADRIRARKFLEVGESTRRPEQGDLVVLSRGASPSHGHVGFFVAETSEKVYVLGGNQTNQVNIQPFDKTRVLGYRRPQPSAHV